MNKYAYARQCPITVAHQHYWFVDVRACSWVTAMSCDIFVTPRWGSITPHRLTENAGAWVNRPPPGGGGGRARRCRRLVTHSIRYGTDGKVVTHRIREGMLKKARR